MPTATLPHRLDRTVVIHAPRETVFRFFTDDARWAAWWGAGSTIDARPGGRVHIRYPTGDEAAGEVVEVRAPELIVFTYGYVKGDLIAPGGSVVTIRLVAHEKGTRLELMHEVADAAVRDHHVQGWRYQLSLFSNIVADEVNAGAQALVDAWFEAWGEPDAAVREQMLVRAASPDVSFHDRYSNIYGMAELLPHIAAAQHFMPGIRVRRDGDVRHCQGTVLVNWIAAGTDGQRRGAGANVFVLGPDGRIAAATGFVF
jgi:uncharacterized protein YndB with AHSA1/START domain